jgi:prepilin-type N-terminal cleavage/methylation domain-containing protein
MVRGSSLIEIIVAMLISSIVFMFTFSIVANVFRNSRALSGVYYTIEAEVLLNTLKSERLASLPDELGEVDVEFSVTDYPGYPGLFYMEVKLLDSESKVVGSARCIHRYD